MALTSVPYRTVLQDEPAAPPQSDPLPPLRALLGIGATLLLLVSEVLV